MVNLGEFGVGGDYEYLIEMPLYPDEVTESINPVWTTQDILGRSAPISAYANTELKTVNFILDLHRDLLTGSYSLTNSDISSSEMQNKGASLKKQAAGLQIETEKGPFGTRSWYTNMNKMLQIACYPQYTSKGLIPPTTYFVFGQMILKGYVTTYSSTWQKPILNTFYGWNKVQITMACYPDSIVSANNILTNISEGTASTQNTYNTVFPNNVGSSNVMARTETTERSNARTSSSIGGNVRQT